MNASIPLSPTSACETCPAHNAANLKTLGVDMSEWDYVIALAGNPNTGKSTVFNALTGLRQHTGNWPGKTVARAEGGFEYAQGKDFPKRYKLVDLPGTYSLLSTSLDEEVARNFILFGRPDVTIVVVDATQLERNLNLALQVMEITDRVVICLNLMDQAKRNGLVIDERRLARDLGVPIIPTSARYRQGLPELLQAVHEMATGAIVGKPYHIQSEPPALKQAVSKLVTQLNAVFPKLPNARWVAQRLLDGDERMMQALQNGELQTLNFAETVNVN